MRTDNERFKIEPMTGNVTVTTWYEQGPNVFTDVPALLGELGLAELGKKLTEEQNRMIRKKHEICCRIEGTLPLSDENGDSYNVFDFERPVKPHVTQKQLQEALRRTALCDPDYRDCAKEFLSEFIPAVRKKSKSLNTEFSKKVAEYEKMKVEYEEQISRCKSEIVNLYRGVHEVVGRFQLTDRGSAVAGGLVPCEAPEHITYLTITPLTDPAVSAEGIMYTIQQMEKKPDPEDDVKERISMAKGRYTSNIREGSGSAAPLSDEIGQGGGNGLRDFIGSIFKR